MKVLIGVDGSAFSDDALRHVMDSLWPEDTTFVVLSAVPPVFVGPGEATAPQAITHLIEHQQQYHEEIAEHAAGRLRSAGLRAKARTFYGDPRMALEETARFEHADLVVVGSHGRTGIKKLLLGSVAAHVVAHAPCPVLVVRTPVWKTERAEREVAVSGAVSD